MICKSLVFFRSKNFFLQCFHCCVFPLSLAVPSVVRGVAAALECLHSLRQTSWLFLQEHLGAEHRLLLGSQRKV